MGILNKKGFVKISLLAGIIIILAVLIFFSYSVFTPTVSSNDITGELTGVDDSENSEFGEMGFSSPILLGSEKLNNNGDDGTDDENGDEKESNGKKKGIVTGGFAPSTGGGGGCVQCPPPTHTECDYENELCVTVGGEGENECSTDADCYCDPRTPGYWKNHLENTDLDCVHDNYDLFDDVTNQSEIHYVLECSGDCDNMTLKLKKFILTAILNICNNNFDFDDIYNGSTIEYWIDQSIYEFHNGNDTTKEYHKNALDDIVNGRGLECYPDEPETHMECDYDGESCIEVLGEGDDECETFEDCEQHTVCNYDRQECMPVEGEGDDECETYDDCFHTECDYEEEVCFTVSSTGDDECETDADCEDECIPPYLAADKTAIPDELCLGEETTITLTISGEGEICDGHYPVDVVLIFDNSGSMDDDGYDQNISDWQPIGDAKYASMYFTDLLGTSDKAGLVSFNTEAKLEHGLTFDKTAVKNAINNMYAGGWTNMSQGIDFANQEIINNGRTDHPWIEVLLSDGNNNCGTDSPPLNCHQLVFDSVQEAADNGIVIYTIALGEKANQTMMEKIANMTGGNFYYAPSSTDLDGIYEEIAGEIVTSAATDVVVIDYLPDYVELKNGTLPADCEYDDVDRKITCEVDKIEINETVEFEFEVYVNQLGYNLTNIYPDSGVEYVNYNETTVFEEFPETYVTVIDCDHTECNYVDEICELVNESGTDECVTFDDCEKHTVCDYQERTCEEVSGAGDDECVTFSDCVHTECCGMSCIDVDSSGTDECSTDAECTDHICNYDEFICQAVAGTGYVECETFQDCPQHKVCDYVFELCVIAQGPGISECSVWQDCEFCGNDRIDPGEDCEPPEDDNNQYCGQSTTDCKGYKLGVRDPFGYCDDECGCLDDPFEYSCVEDECGAECDEDEDCPCPQDGCVGPDYYDYPAHGLCTEECVCDISEEPCTDPCKPDITEDDPRCTRLVCDYQEDVCVLVEGDGADQCSTYSDCIHTECNYVKFTCDILESQGIDECVTFDDCEKHTVCDYDDRTCDIVEGSGTDQCSTFSDCVHTECNYDTFTCDSVASTGTSECQTFQDCPQHTVCDYVFELCVTVEGEGQNECVIWEDCLMCGDGVVTPPEQCELPGTQNNQYCAQNTWECLGNKYGVRDAYGDCSQVCGCLLDPFQYSCVEGKCGAECDSDDDCDCPGDRCHHRYPNWIDYPEHSECSQEDCSCTDCESVETICDPKCLGDCEVDVWTGHDMNPTWGYPYSATDDIYIVAQSNGQCDGWTIRIRYWWCSCPNKDPEQSAIEVTRDDFSAKYDRLCSANAAGADNPTHSLECAPCEWRDYRPEFPKDDGKKFWTGVGTSTGTFQIDLREYHDCYERKSALNQGKAVALACAAKSEDDPECSSFGQDICESFGCMWQDAGCGGGSFACSNVRKRATCTGVGCEWKSDTEITGDFCRKPTSDPFSFDCSDITNRGNCNDYTNGKCSWEAAHCYGSI